MDYGTINLFIIFGLLIYMDWSIYRWIDREF
jgi:hypothetical protein